MKPDPKRIRELFVATVGKVDPERWEAFLNAMRRRRRAARGTCELLLDAHREAGSFLKGPAVAISPPSAIAGPRQR